MKDVGKIRLLIFESEIIGVTVLCRYKCDVMKTISEDTNWNNLDSGSSKYCEHSEREEYLQYHCFVVYAYVPINITLLLLGHW